MPAYSDQNFAVSGSPRSHVALSVGRYDPGQRDVTDMSAIRSAATVFIERFGDQAARQATVRAEELLHAENYEGRVRWQLIAREIRDLMTTSDLQKFQSSLIAVNEVAGASGHSGGYR